MPASLRQRLLRRRQCIKGKAVQFLPLFGFHDGISIQSCFGILEDIRHQSGDTYGVVAVIKPIDKTDSRLAGDQPLPERLDTTTDSATHAHTCNYIMLAHVLLLL